MTKVLVTGGAGFIGHHLIEHLVKNTDWDIVIMDKLTYASGGLTRLRDIQCVDMNKITVLTTDFCNPIPKGVAQEIGDVDYIIHMAAETHVENSIKDPEPFITTNVLGTMHMLNFARTIDSLKMFLYFSTDEVYGPADPGVYHKETDPYNATNPYSAAKAGGEQVTMAFGNTYGLPVMVTNTMNVYGERQHSEKFIPMTIRNVMEGNKVIIHSDATKTISGSRHWIHARNVADAALFLLAHGETRDRFNIVGEREVSNLDMALLIAEYVGKELNYEMVDFHSSRPGHDLRYALDGTKLADAGWSHPVSFEESLKKTIEWTIENKQWLNMESF